jgi:hypothetical protein
MNTELFKDDLDRLDSGISDHPDTATYMRQGRVVRRRRQGLVAVGAGALVAAAITPAFVLGGGTATRSPADDVATQATGTTPGRAVTNLVPVDPSFGEGMQAAVGASLPQARFLGETIGDHLADAPDGPVVAAGTPPDWGNVFSWTQQYSLEGLQFFDVSSEWLPEDGASRVCGDDAYAIQKSCDVVNSGAGYVTVLHDGVRLSGEAEGEWARIVEFISPPAPGSRGARVTQVSAQVEGMTWAEAQLALPPLGQLGSLAASAELRLPEPAVIPSLDQTK